MVFQNDQEIILHLMQRKELETGEYYVKKNTYVFLQCDTLEFGRYIYLDVSGEVTASVLKVAE